MNLIFTLAIATASLTGVSAASSLRGVADTFEDQVAVALGGHQKQDDSEEEETALTSIAFSTTTECTTGGGATPQRCLGMKADSAKVAAQSGESASGACDRDYGWAGYTQAYLCRPSGDFACGLRGLGTVTNGLGDFQSISLSDTCTTFVGLEGKESPALRG